MSNVPEERDAQDPDSTADGVVDQADEQSAGPSTAESGAVDSERDESGLAAADDERAEVSPVEGDSVEGDSDPAAPDGAESEMSSPENGSVDSTDEEAADEEVADEGSAEVDAGEEESSDDGPAKDWFIVKVQVNREDSIRAALMRRIKIAGLDEYFGQIVIPTEDVAEYNKAGKRRIVKKKLYPGYIMVELELNDDTWFLVRETPGIGDFTGSAGKPTPMEAHEVQRIINVSLGSEAGDAPVKTAIPFKSGDRVRVKEGNFENFEGEVESIDEANGRVTIMINIFGRSTPVELEHWQIENV